MERKTATKFLAQGQGVCVLVCVMTVGGFKIKEQLKKTGEKSRECAQTHKRDSLTIDRVQWWKWQL